jgi:hypothetical protein
MRTSNLMPTTSTGPWPSALHAEDTLADSRQEPPERLAVTSAVLRAFRRYGWTITEERSAGWLYLIARGHGQSAVYKLVGPSFDHTGSHYRGYRIA